MNPGAVSQIPFFTHLNNKHAECVLVFRAIDDIMLNEIRENDISYM